MQKIYVFDLDGTLADSMPLAVQLTLDVLDEYGIVYPDNIVDITMPMGFRGVAEYFSTQLGVPLTAEQIYAIFTNRLKEAYEKDILLKPHVKETLEALKAQGARLNVLTATAYTLMAPCLQRNGILHLFENVWSAEDFQLAKSNTRIYQAVAERLGVTTAEYVMVDDNVQVLQTARRAGVYTIGMHDSFSKESVVRAACDRYIYTFDELL